MSDIEVIEWIVPERIERVDGELPIEAPDPPAVEKTSTNIQDISLDLFAAPDLELSKPTPLSLDLAFDMDAPGLAERVAKVVETAYAFGSMPGVEELKRAFHGTIAKGETFRGMPAGGRGEKRYEGLATPNRHKLLQAFDRGLTKLVERIPEHHKLIQACAVRLSHQRLIAGRKQACQEALRYLRFSDGATEATALETLRNTNPVLRLSGPDATVLIAAMAAIATMREHIGMAEEAQEVIDNVPRDQRSAYRLALLGPVAAQQDLFKHASPSPMPATIPRKEPTPELAASREQLATHLNTFCARFPILYRLWSTKAVFHARALLSKPTNIQAIKGAIADSSDLRDAVNSVLRKTIHAGDEMTETLTSNPERVWRYSVMIDQALDKFGVPPGTIAWRVAADLMVDNAGSHLARAAEVAGNLAFATVLLPGGQPIAAAANAVAMVLQAAATTEKLKREYEVDLAYRAALDPQLAIAIRPGSYAASILVLSTLLPRARNSAAYNLGATALTWVIE